jgi:type VI secretion system protein ImpI/type VI secretion system protein
MSEITLSVLRCPDSAVPETRTARGGEMTLGRGAECDWPLADPDRVLSKKHCVVEFFGGGWQLRDLSTNGTFVNHATTPVGRDHTRPLLDGDRLRLGSYEIEVRIAEASASASPGWGAPAADPFGAAPAADPFRATPGGGFGGMGSPGIGSPGMGSPGLLPDDFDPFADSPAPMPDHAPSTAEAFMVPPALPAGKAVIPDDWDLDLTPRPAAAPPPPAPPPQAPPPIVAAPPAFSPPPRPAAPPAAEHDPFAEPGDGPPVAMAPLPVATPAAAPHAPPHVASPPAPPPSGNATGGLAALQAGAGLPPTPHPDPEAALHSAGAVLRAAVAGMRALLIARADVKREFRIEQTMLRAAGNNPLKFAATEEQALAALLDPRTPALKAMQETVDDLTAHQVAALAATQAAARALLDRLAPAALEAEDPGGGLLPGAREKRLWEAYRRRHAQLVEQFEDDFDSAFGKAFARAYEQATGRGSE